MRCPKCDSGMSRGKTFWICLECDHQLHDNAPPSPAQEDLSSADLEPLPSVLALPWREFRRESHPVMRLHRLCDVTEVLTRFLTITALGEVRRSVSDAGLPEEGLIVFYDSIPPPKWAEESQFWFKTRE